MLNRSVPAFSGPVVRDSFLLLGAVLGTLLMFSAASTADVSKHMDSQKKDVSGKARRVKVAGVDFKGNSVFSDARLRKVIADDIGKSLTLKGIRSMADSVQHFYRNAGYSLAHVIVPRQSFSPQHPVQLLVLEGRLGSIKIHGAKRYSADRIRKTLHNAGADHGKPIRLAAIKKALTLLNRQSGIHTSVNLHSGKRRGFTNINVKVHEKPLFSGSLTFNNYGSRTTGRYRAIPSFTVSDPLGIGDRLRGLGVHTFGHGSANFGRLSYDIPVNTHGTRLKFYGSGGSISVGQKLQPLNIKGTNWSAGAGVIQNQIISPRTSLKYHFWFVASSLKQSVLGRQISNDEVRKLRAGVSLTHHNLRGHTRVNLDIHQGLGHVLGAMRNNSKKSSRAGAGADNRFTKLTLSIRHIQRLSRRIVVIPRFRGQYAFNSLVTGEQLYLGGAHSVHGYRQSAYSGDSGYTASVEGRYSLLSSNDHYQLFGRLSQGTVYTRQPSLGHSHTRYLSGASLGFLVRPVQGLRIKGSISAALGPAHSKDNHIFYIETRYGF